MFYTITMDHEEAKWLIDLLKRLQIARINTGAAEITDDDVERAQSFISRIRATVKKC